MFDCPTQGLKMYELVLFDNIFVQLFSSSFCSFFLLLPSRRLSITFDIQIDLKTRSQFRTLSNIQDGGFCVNS